jgi:DNA-binding NtrC family response regulator
MDSILIVDDDFNVLTSLKRALMDEPYNVLVAENAEEGLELMKKHHIKVVISDEKMPGMSGSEFLSLVKRLYPNTVRIMLTGNASIEAAMNAVNKGEIYRFFSKPWDDIQLRLAIRSAIEKYDLEEENRRLLRMVKRQADELRQLERLYPGITKIQKDEDGSFVLPEIDDADTEIKKIISGE